MRSALREPVLDYGERRRAVRERPRVVPNIINQGSIDYTVCFVTVVLVLVGVVMIFSAGFHNAATRSEFGYNMFHFLQRQSLFAGIGLLVMLFMSRVPYRLLLRTGWPLYIASGVMLIYVALFGRAVGGAQRWMNLPLIGRFQPSEITKVAVILVLSSIIFFKKDILDTWKGFLYLSGIVGVAAGLVLVGNLSTAIIVGIIGMSIIFVASPHVGRFIAIGGAAVGVLVSYIGFFAQDFRGARFDAWLRPFDFPQGVGYQTIQSLYAIASGGIFGLGIGQSRQKSFLPEPHNDMIFAIISEELGFAGAVFILALFAILIWRGIKIAMNATDLFGALVATGIVVMIAGQAIINVAVVTNSIPNTGIPMPFISYGGTSLLVTMFLIGVLLNISRYHRA